MTTVLTQATERDAITRTIQTYVEGGISGKGKDMKPAFHENATIHGYVGTDLFGGPIQMLFDWNDGNGPASDLKANITDITSGRWQNSFIWSRAKRRLRNSSWIVSPCSTRPSRKWCAKLKAFAGAPIRWQCGGRRVRPQSTARRSGA